MHQCCCGKLEDTICDGMRHTLLASSICGIHSGVKAIGDLLCCVLQGASCAVCHGGVSIPSTASCILESRIDSRDKAIKAALQALCTRERVVMRFTAMRLILMMRRDTNKMKNSFRRLSLGILLPEED